MRNLSTNPTDRQTNTHKLRQKRHHIAMTIIVTTVLCDWTSSVKGKGNCIFYIIINQVFI